MAPETAMADLETSECRQYSAAQHYAICSSLQMQGENPQVSPQMLWAFNALFAPGFSMSRIQYSMFTCLEKWYVRWGFLWAI